MITTCKQPNIAGAAEPHLHKTLLAHAVHENGRAILLWQGVCTLARQRALLALATHCQPENCPVIPHLLLAWGRRSFALFEIFFALVNNLSLSNTGPLPSALQPKIKHLLLPWKGGGLPPGYQCIGIYIARYPLWICLNAGITLAYPENIRGIFSFAFYRLQKLVPSPPSTAHRISLSSALNTLFFYSLTHWCM